MRVKVTFRVSKEMKKILLITGLFLFIPSICWAGGIKLPSGAQDIYAVGGKRAYILKVKLTPKVTGSKVYWQDKKDIDWQEEIKKANLPLVMLDKEVLGTDSFEDWTDFPIFGRGGLIQKRINLTRGEHSIKILENDSFKVEYTLLEPIADHLPAVTRKEPEITFKKINPTKYYVWVRGAEGPFWLVFSEGFHKQWRAYVQTEDRRQNIDNRKWNIIANYPRLGVKEAKYLQRFTPSDIRYLFRRADIKKHYLVNGYANGWYIDPGELGLGENFTLVLYFWPQSLFYLGLGISGVTLIGCLGYLLANFIKKKPKNEA